MNVYKLSGDDGANVSFSVNGDTFTVNGVGGQARHELFVALNGYLNCRPGEPAWLLELCDALNPVPVPERFSNRTQVQNQSE